jgi:hypothetical protein
MHSQAMPAAPAQISQVSPKPGLPGERSPCRRYSIRRSSALWRSCRGHSALETQGYMAALESVEGNIGPFAAFLAQACRGSPDRFAVWLRFPRLSQQTLKTFGHFRVHVLYKRPEIPANGVIPAIAVSVTYRIHEKAENTGSTPVSATNALRINHLQKGMHRLGTGAFAPKSSSRLESLKSAAAAVGTGLDRKLGPRS